MRDDSNEEKSPEGQLPLGGVERAADMNSVSDDNAPHLDAEQNADQPHEADNRRGDDEENDVFHGLGPRKDCVADAANQEAKPIAAFLAGWLACYQHRVESNAQGAQIDGRNVHGVAGLDPRLSPSGVGHLLTPRRNAPISEDGTTRQNKSPEAVCRGQE